MTEADESKSAPAPSTPTPSESEGPWWRRRPKPSHPVPTGCRRVYVPVYGYLDADDDHRARVNKFFHAPMLILALLVLPLVAIEFLGATKEGTGADAVYPFLAHPVVRVITAALMGFIWLAFFVEFVVKIWIAPSRLKYATKNWLDIVIILLPMLRVLRGVGALRAAKVARTAQVFRLRGVAMKLLRTAAAIVVGFETVRRLGERFRKPDDDAPPDYTEWSRASLIAEINRLHERIETLETDLEHENKPKTPPNIA